MEKVKDRAVEGKGEEVKKRGRPSNLERLGREKTSSTGNIEELLDRGKRKERKHDQGLEEGENGGVEELLKRNRLTGSAPKEGQFLKRELERCWKGLRKV